MIGSAEKLTVAKMGTSGVGFSNSPHNFLPKCRDFEYVFTIVLHLSGIKTIETLI